ncbi:MAG: endonuclease [Sulfurimonas sp. RIFCSPHIGHO2_12_FULL_36_9]|uniref:endonuclease/exonuclease/phosphatase family protein n=1 Tax=Sulfurimonas sp. RIFCSPLOWO2_12_36_12 TaxID=1802253 RepID=UPI0008B55388|nr:endonuclease/exonuclease/phosphatase family protein [Sulfurimonas sp. RIFCSPLOWO2_12_36_12]OHD96977.1 MAG: endonuclease [Sulfurimonas sp. RIFCSPHIGHO2_12_FULL_36_9]OHD97528.1 MAG: endonuclease [Sulfurimonas sp. RIFCSPLOWO2_02_FULL_36_28]OHE01079.1 MAG: endonuclease [Sulfurimonas sp. RIFCSPLOWO2_12_36_12]
MKYILLVLLISASLFGDKILKIATYNVENLFDLQKSGYEYSEYVPNGSSEWNQKNYKIKLKNIAQVIKDIDADIIALQEIESLQALLDLRFALKQNGLYYEHYAIADKKNTTVKVAILSKIPFLYSKELSVTQTYEYRNILETKFKIDDKELYIFVNHWKSKSGPESMRVISAKTLKNRITEIGYDKNIVLLGDFNSDYEEHLKFVKKRNHNDTDGITGINHILGTINQRNYSSYLNYTKNSFYNLWYDANEENRYTYIYKGKKEALDSILISQSLLGKKGIFYINKSVTNFNKEYLFKKSNINRWEISRAKVRKHKGKGYSDHLAIVAKFKIN